MCVAKEKVAKNASELTKDVLLKSLQASYTTKELNTPTKNTSNTHKPRPEKTVLLFSVQPSGDANATGTLTTKKNDKAIKANKVV